MRHGNQVDLVTVFHPEGNPPYPTAAPQVVSHLADADALVAEFDGLREYVEASLGYTFRSYVTSAVTSRPANDAFGCSRRRCERTRQAGNAGLSERAPP